MTSGAPVETSVNLLLQLASPAARALALGGAAALGLAAFRVRTTTVRLFTWTAVLYAALAMPLLGWLLPPLSFSTPAFLQHASAQSAAQPASEAVRSRQTRVTANSSSANLVRIPAASSIATSSAASYRRSLSWSSLPWSLVAEAIYLAVSSLLLLRFLIGLAFAARLLRTSQTIRELRLTARLASHTARAGLQCTPQVAETELIAVPITLGVRRPTVLLPSNWREWDDVKLDSVIAHEVSHVTRRDPLTQRISLLHRAIFWFSPLAWWLDRHLATLAEQASDEAALLCGINRKDYARTLLGFFEALHSAPGRVWWPGVAMAKSGQAEKRLERILCWRGATPMNLTKPVAAVIIALAIPVVYLTASARPAHDGIAPRAPLAAQHQLPAEAPRAASAPAAIPGAAPVVAIAPMAASAALAPAIASGQAVAPVANVAPAVPAVNGNSYSYGYDDDVRFVIAAGNSDSFTMSGSTADVRHVERLKKQIVGDFIWFQRDERSYVIRDQATIDRARKFWAAQEELGKKQEELGRQQEVLGEQQEKLGDQMEKVHVKVPDMTAELDKLKAKLMKLNSSATMEEVGEIQSEIGDLQSKIGDLQSQAGEAQGKLGEQQGALGAKQGKLGEQQGELGRQHAELGEQASRQMKELLDEAIKKGTAQPEL